MHRINRYANIVLSAGLLLTFSAQRQVAETLWEEPTSRFEVLQMLLAEHPSDPDLPQYSILPAVLSPFTSFWGTLPVELEGRPDLWTWAITDGSDEQFVIREAALESLGFPRPRGYRR